MAKRKFEQFMENVGEMATECKLCFKTLQNHRSLNCQHNFCLECLENMVKMKGKLTCPSCSKSYTISEGDLQNLKSNTFLNNVLELAEKFGNKDKVKCVCGKGKLVKNYCQECRHYLCSTCSDHHKILPIVANHKLYSVDDLTLMTPLEIASIHPPLCGLHSKPFEFYCTDCKQAICVDCIIKGHTECKEQPQLVTISEAFQAFKESSEELDKSVEDCKSNLQDCLDVVIENAKKLEHSRQNSLRGIDGQIEEMVEILKKNGEKFKSEVEAVYKEKREVTTEQIDELKTTISELDTKQKHLKKLLNSDEATGIHLSNKVVTSLENSITELPKLEPSDNGEIYYFQNKQEMSSLKECPIGHIAQFKLCAVDCLELRGGEPVTQGQTIIVKVIKKKDECDINQLKAKLMDPTGESSIAEIVNENGEYVVKGVSANPGLCKVEVWDIEKPNRSLQIVVYVEKEGLVNAFKVSQGFVRDIVKCKDNFLFISLRTNLVYKYRQTGESLSLIALPKGVQVNRMYKMKNGCIVFSDYGSSIKICNMNFKVIKSIGEGVLKDPHGIHVDETSNKVYVADGNGGCVFLFDINSGQMIRKISSTGNQESQLWDVIDVTLNAQGDILVLEKINNNRLQLFDNTGSFIKGLVKGGDENGKVRFPRAVVVDKDDNIIIASCHKLQMFDSDGNFIKRIDKPEDGINDSFGLSIISSNPRRVAVTNNGDATVKIFNY